MVGCAPFEKRPNAFGQSSQCLVWLCCAESGQVEFSTGGEERGREGVRGEGVRLKSGQRG